MTVTDKDLNIDTRLVSKLDMMCHKIKHNFDNLIICDGDEGYGKSNLTAGVGYYCAWKLGRKFTVDNVFFDINPMVNFACSTEKQVIMWDEAALGGLASGWQSKFQQKLLKMLMVARKKNHIYIINIPKFFKLNEYLVIDRCIALLHVYSPDQITRGSFVYYRKESKDKLFYDWKKKHRRNYKSYYDFNGRFGKYLPKVIDEVAYEAKKDQAILSLVEDDGISKEEKEFIELKHKISHVKGLTQLDMASQLGKTTKTLQRWAKLHEKYPDFLEKSDLKT